MTTPLLSVNINKFALVRNSRGRDAPNLLRAADSMLAAGAHGITIHPRMDQRHVRFDDVLPLARHMSQHHPQVELNIECEDHPGLIDLVIEADPAQCTLVPVSPGEVTSDHGWTLPRQLERLRPTVDRLRRRGIRVSLFAECDPQAMPHFAATGAQRVELYTGPYAWAWGTDTQDIEVQRVAATTAAARAVGLGVNAGHDLDRHNLAGLRDMTGVDEVSIGHALVCRALEVGGRQSVQELISALGWPVTG
ncbi:MAG: pyridoxine 5-phosphate synthase [Myxococcota bacterium]|jgi:pyridoxine 5-phosphate synthase